MELKRYRDRTHHREFEAVQLTPDNMEEVAKHLRLEYVKDYVQEDGTVEEALFRTGRAEPVVIGMFVVQRVNSNEQAHAVYAGDFDYFYEEIPLHAFVPQIMYSNDDLYPTPCVFCGNERDTVPYHRDLIPGETMKLPDGTTLIIKER